MTDMLFCRAELLVTLCFEQINANDDQVRNTQQTWNLPAFLAAAAQSSNTECSCGFTAVDGSTSVQRRASVQRWMRMDCSRLYSSSTTDDFSRQRLNMDSMPDESALLKFTHKHTSLWVITKCINNKHLRHVIDIDDRQHYQHHTVGLNCIIATVSVD